MFFVIPPLKWQSPRYASFEQIVRGAIGVLQGNPHVTKQLGWDISYEAMSNRVDEFNATLCEKMGWTDYITGSTGGAAAGSPFRPSNLLEHLKNAAAGAKTIVQMIASRDEAVVRDEAERRAKICVACPKNEQGDWLSTFTVPASEAIRMAMNQLRAWNLETTQDDKLGVCELCDCPMRLKVHFPMKRIVDGLGVQKIEQLPDNCWIKQANK